MGVVDGLELFRNSPFPEALAISSKLGEPGEERTRTTMDTDLEPTMAARERTSRACSD